MLNYSKFLLSSIFNNFFFQLDDSVFTETPDDNIDVIDTDSTFYKDLIRVIAIDVAVIVVFGLLFDLICYCKKSSTNENVAAKGYTIGMIQAAKRKCSIKKGVLRNLSKFTGKQLCQSLFFDKAADLRPTTLLKKRLWHRCFPVNFEKFLRAHFLQITFGRLLLYDSKVEPFGKRNLYKAIHTWQFSFESAMLVLLL